MYAVFPVEEKMPATWARTEYMMNKDTNVPVNRPETTQKENSMSNSTILL
jgi:hypothetical protein